MNAGRYGSREARRAAVVFFVLLVLTVVPPFTLVTTWLFPIPLLTFWWLQMHRTALALTGVVAAAMWLTGLGLAGLFAAVGVGFVAFVMAEALRGGDTPFAPIITGSLVFIMMELVMLAFTRWTGVDLFQSLAAEVERSLREQGAFGLDDAGVRNLAAQMVQWTRLMFPSVIAVMAMLVATVNLVSARLLLRRLLPERPFLSAVRLPVSVVVLYVLALGAVLAGWPKEWPIVWQTVNNAAFLAGLFLGVQGVSFLWRRVRGRAGQYVWLALMIAGSLFRPISSIYVVLGVMDVMQQHRRNPLR
ncbi:DUF2232 domain-containing protein [Alicyclobacillus sp.]|uniref:DUF2232 domain-containing protein n=1 Tax=Alicyclobacillus sp. TaxID=61169 RepID=UPI0025C22494|nr:DUF2232 domain-containing protein [Alicyclobacillus sp.]MCL6516022.1 YybS family protein [Alicyclobacillus sp.]